MNEYYELRFFNEREYNNKWEAWMIIHSTYNVVLPFHFFFDYSSLNPKVHSTPLVKIEDGENNLPHFLRLCCRIAATIWLFFFCLLTSHSMHSRWFGVHSWFIYLFPTLVTIIITTRMFIFIFIIFVNIILHVQSRTRLSFQMVMPVDSCAAYSFKPFFTIFVNNWKYVFNGSLHIINRGCY